MRLLDVTANNGLTVEDAEGSANVLMLIVVLTLSFALPVLYGTDTDILVAADARECRFRETDQARALGKGPCTALDSFAWGAAQEHPVLSFRLADSSWMSILYLNISLALAGSCLLCMYFNRARTCPVFFRRWYKVFKWWIVLAYCLYFAGLTLFLAAMMDLTVAVYPSYSPSNYFDPDTGQMIEQDDSEPVLYDCTSRYNQAMLDSSLLGVAFSVLLTIWMAVFSVNRKEIDAVLAPHKDKLDAHGLTLNTLAMVADDGALLGVLGEIGIERLGDRIRIATAVRAATIAPFKGCKRACRWCCCCCWVPFRSSRAQSES